MREAGWAPNNEVMCGQAYRAAWRASLGGRQNDWGRKGTGT